MSGGELHGQLERYSSHNLGKKHWDPEQERYKKAAERQFNYKSYLVLQLSETMVKRKQGS